MNQIFEKYRVFKVIHKNEGYYSRFSLKKPLSTAEFRAYFEIPEDSQVTPLLDWRMKNGGKVGEEAGET